MMRMEYSETGVFEDLQTQTVLNREFPVPEYSVTQSDDRLEIETEAFHMIYDKKKFSEEGLFIDVKYDFTNYGGRWYFGAKTYSFPPREHNLKGTMRTLDRADGEVELEYGLMDKSGRTFFDDSKSFVFDEENMPSKRKHEEIDVYYLAYGRDYFACLRDFYKLSGAVPLLPRYALGNWWSRYWKYSEESYIELLTEFEKRNIPFSVAVMDMDWHIVDVPMESGGGWTGYTWNNDLFPNPERFLSWLHEHNYHVTLNVHPADGIRAYEDCYPEVAEAMGVDAKKEEPVNFDIADPKFVDVYFEKVHHPMEKEGVDFWWIDWQQGQSTKIEGLDPLWMLNHYHFLDSGRDGKRPMTFSRYAGPGSHRYPVGFSGDTHITWESLDFQPYFTSTASNIGYGWWSHDIGGHMLGYRDDELEARWYQYGVFSPINRLHSSNSAFSGKEPWNFSMEVRSTMDDFLRLRHKLVPYLYTMNYRAWKEDTPIVVPMYYDYPETVFWGKNQAPNQYFFGSELMVTPVTTKCIPELKRAKTKVWLPEGTWFDFFNGMIYEGGRSMDLYRTLEEIPVLAKAGAIIPMTEKISALDVESNPDELTVRVYAGADNTFALYEDDNTTMAYEKDDCAKTSMTLDWGARKFTIAPVEGNQSLVPESRMYCVEFGGSTAKEAKVFVNGVEADAEVKEKDGLLTIAVTDVKPQDTVTICLPEDTEIAKNDVMTRAMDLLLHAEISYITKEQIANLLHKADGKVAILAAELQSMELSNDLRGALLEIITA